MISLTDEQRLAVRHQGNATLNACPGSGKTRVILAKLLHLAEHVVETPRSIACITYTNTAVDEIEERLKRFGDQRLLSRCEIATIHAFCLEFVLRPYAWLVPEVPRNFSILTQQMGAFEQIVEVVEDELNRSIVRTTFDDYGSLRIDTDGSPTGNGIEAGVVTEASARRYWEVCRNRGFLDFSTVLYYSLVILREFPFVGVGLASRFKWVLIDEFQDTTDVQLEILRQIEMHNRTGFFLVGDENQSIQSFAGARPDLAEAFTTDIEARRDLGLSGNFRSSQQIVDLAESCISRTPAMVAIGENASWADSPIHVHTATAIEAITDHFLPSLEEHQIPLGKAAILAPWWQHLIPIARRLRGFDVPVFGPGARPYKRSRLFAVLAEQLGACSEANHFLGVPGVERGVFHLISEATGASRYDVFSYDGRRTVIRLIYEARRLSELGHGGVQWLTDVAASSTDILIDDGWLPQHAHSLLTNSVADMVSDMERQNVDVANLEVSDLGLFANPDDAIKLLTLHRAKGREFEAVALVHMNEGQLPHFSASTVEEFDEGRRLFYVGLTRAKRHLMVASNDSRFNNPPSRYIGECNL